MANECWWKWAMAAVVVCASTGAMAQVPCLSDEDCDDGRFCNGVETCTTGTCGPGLPPDCSDEVSCTTDTCSESTQSCQHTGPDADADGHTDASCGGDDCNDADATAYPGNTEVCDPTGHDEDCDPATFGPQDLDGDGYYDAACCNGSNCGDDCNDLNAGTHPTEAEVCNGLDDNCDGNVDEGVLVSQFVDGDADGHGAAGSPPVGQCPGTPGYSTLHNDCDDTIPAVQPGAMVCGSPGEIKVCDSSGVFVSQGCKGICSTQANRTGLCFPRGGGP